jgi:microcystin-dependent protein
VPGYPAPLIKFREADLNYNPLAGGKLWSYVAGTSTPLATYTDALLGTPNANPTVLDAQGYASVFIADGVGYKFVLTDSLGNTQWTVDNVQVPQVQAPVTAVAVPPGGVMLYGGTVAPTGWLLCDGSQVSRTTFPDLFNAIGETYGAGNGSTTFNVPDARQRFPLGKAASGTGATLGALGGTIDHAHAGPGHTHTITAHSHTMPHTHVVPYNGWTTAAATPPAAGVLQAGGTGSGPESTVTQATASNVTGQPTPASTDAQSLTTNSDGTEQTGTANPPFLTFNYIIKT